MKKISVLLCILCFVSLTSQAQQDKSKRPSKPDSLTVVIDRDVTIAISYSRPAVKGRALGVDIAPLNKVWRTGANEATTFSIDKNVTIAGKELMAGKYSIYSIPKENSVTVIFNKTWDQWGTKYDEQEDALRIDVPVYKNVPFTELFTIKAKKDGKVDFMWGDYGFGFVVK